jgi:hypothetical protein
MNMKISTPILMGMLVMFLSMEVYAQNGDEDPGPPPVDGGGPGDPDAEIPFDGGLSLLLVAGAGYGAKKAADHRKAMRSIGSGKRERP